jgi:hypothetical protein
MEQTSPRFNILQILLIAASALALPGFIAYLVVSHGGLADPIKFTTGVLKLGVTYFIITGAIAGVYARTKHSSLWPTVLASMVFFLGHAALVGGGLLSVELRNAKNERLQAELDRADQQASREVAAMLDKHTDDPNALPQIAARQNAAFAKVAANLSGDDAIIARVMMKFTADSAATVAEYQRALKPFTDAGGAAPEALNSLETIREHRKLLKTATTAHQSLLTQLNMFGRLIEMDAVELGLSRPKAKELGRMATSTQTFALSTQIHKLEHQGLVLIDEHLAFLESQWGHWKVKDGDYYFDTTGAQVDAFNKRTRTMGDIITKQDQLQTQLAGLMKNLASGG